MMSVGTELDFRDAIQKFIDENPQYQNGVFDMLVLVVNGKVKVEDSNIWDDEYLR
jgi:hypothetical protein